VRGKNPAGWMRRVNKSKPRGVVERATVFVTVEISTPGSCCGRAEAVIHDAAGGSWDACMVERAESQAEVGALALALLCDVLADLRGRRVQAGKTSLAVVCDDPAALEILTGQRLPTTGDLALLACRLRNELAEMPGELRGPAKGDRRRFKALRRAVKAHRESLGAVPC